MQVKHLAKHFGADLVGVASAATLNAHPPDPKWPQTPERISPYVKSVIVVAQRIPAGAFRCRSYVPVQYIEFDGGHAIPPEVVRALAALASPPP